MVFKISFLNLSEETVSLRSIFGLAVPMTFHENTAHGIPHPLPLLHIVSTNAVLPIPGLVASTIISDSAIHPSSYPNRKT